MNETQTTRVILQLKESNAYEAVAWRGMRYSGLLLIPLAWGHVLIENVPVGVHRINLDYVAMRWAMLGCRVFYFLLLAFAFAHGMNGLRQVLNDYILNEKWRRATSWFLLGVWLVISLIGGLAIVGGVGQP